MNVMDIVIIAAVAALLALCIRSFLKGGGECADCTAEGCTAHNRRHGKCAAADDMLHRVDAAFAEADHKAPGA